MHYNNLSYTEKVKFNELLLSYSLKRCSTLDEILPITSFYERESADGFQSQSIAAKRMLYKMSKCKTT